LPFASIGAAVGVMLGGVILLLTTTYAVRLQRLATDAAEPPP
jgi:hypothetical protein